MNSIQSKTVASLAFDGGTLLLSDEGVRSAIGGHDGLWTWDGRVSAWRCDAIHYPRVIRELPECLGHGLRDEVPKPACVFWPEVSLPRLRPEQSEALAAWTRAGCRGQVIMPTGTGKTEVALAAMAQTQTATLVVAPIRDLMYQWHRRILKGLEYDAGIVGDNTFNLQPVTVTTYDSACIHMAQIGDRFGLLIFDEEHHLPGPTYREAAIMSTAPMRLGLTATAQRYDGRQVDLDWLIGPIAYDMPFREARGSALADFAVVRIPVHLDDQEQASYDRCSRQVRHFMAERRKDQTGYSWKDLCGESGKDPAARLAMKAYRLKQSIEDRAAEKLRVLEDLFRLHAGQKTIVFAGSNAMAMDVSRRFLLPTILSHTRKKERLAVLDGFAGGTFPVIVANQVLDEGIDVPEAKVAVVIGGQASTRQAKQRLGRILRRAGNARATLYEVVCQTAGETQRSRQRRRSDAYERTSHRRV
ncbi:MAG: DEAD/DEAH box helicase family protein [Sedimentisphaerales bacterium]|nr:DEAD/DEAH box helicase family protein [Sedimentisphaerales bacterium]